MPSRKKRQKKEKKVVSKKILIFCEGQTEKIFISYLKDILESKISIKYENLKGEIKKEKIVSKKKHLINEYENIYKFFLLCDFEHAKNISRDKELDVIISNPSIEIILLFFFCGLEKSKIEILIKSSTQQVIKEIEKILNIKYQKNGEFLNDLFEKNIKKENLKIFKKNVKTLEKIDKNNQNLSFCKILELFEKQSK